MIETWLAPVVPIVVGALLAGWFAELRSGKRAKKSFDDGFLLLQSSVEHNRARSEERHVENVGRLEAIALDVKRINGTVREHDVKIDHLWEKR